MGLSQQTKINTDIRKRPSNPEQENSHEQNTNPEQNQIDEMTSAMNDAVEYAEQKSGIKGLFSKVGHAIGKGFNKGWDKTKIHAKNAWSDITLAYFATKEARKYRHEEAKRDKLIAKAEAAGLVVDRDPGDPEGLKHHIDLNDLAYRRNKSKLGSTVPVVEENIIAEPVEAEQEQPIEEAATESAEEISAETEEKENVVPEVDPVFEKNDNLYYHDIIKFADELKAYIEESYSEVDGEVKLSRNPDEMVKTIMQRAAGLTSLTGHYIQNRHAHEVHPEVDNARELPDVVEDTEVDEDKQIE